MYALALRTVHKSYMGKKKGILNLTRVGTCPICQQRVERAPEDIFFPYCGYTCKRVVQRKEEETEKAKIAKWDRWFEEQYEKNKERRERAILRQIRVEKINELQKRIAQCKFEYEKYAALAETLPERSEKRWRAQERSRAWYRKMIHTQIDIRELENGEKSK